VFVQCISCKSAETVYDFRTNFISIFLFCVLTIKKNLLRNLPFLFFFAYVFFPTTTATQHVRWNLKARSTGTALALHPNNPRTTYIEDDSGNFVITRDGGKTWNITGNVPLLNVRQLVIHPTDTATIFCASASGGLFRSTEEGTEWIAVIPNFGIQGESIVFDPLHPDTMYAGNSINGKVLKSFDRGENWNEGGEAGSTVTSLAIRSDSTNILYAGTTDGTISKSTDFGMTWKIVKPAYAHSIPCIVISKANPLIAYAIALEGALDGTGVWKTTNGGEQWFQTSLQSISLHALAIQNDNPNTVYAGTFSENIASVYKTSDGGTTWHTLQNGILPSSSITNIKVHPFDSAKIWCSMINANSGVYRWEPPSAYIRGFVMDNTTGDTVKNGFLTLRSTHDTIQLDKTNGTFEFSLFELDSTFTTSVHAEAYPFYMFNSSVIFFPDSIVRRNFLLQKLPNSYIAGSVLDSNENISLVSDVQLFLKTSLGNYSISRTTDENGTFWFDSLYLTHPPIVEYQNLDIHPHQLPYLDTTLNSLVLDSAGIIRNAFVSKADVFLVGADSINYFSYYTTAFRDLGLSSYRWNVHQRGPAPFAQGKLFRKNIVVYFSGTNNAPFLEEELAGMQTYLSLGGNLFLTGQNIIERNDSSLFFTNVLPVSFLGNNSSTVCKSMFPHEIFGTMQFPTVGSGANNQTSRDNLDSSNIRVRAVLGYGNNASLGVAGIRADSIGNVKSKVMFFGFGFEAIGNALSRKQILQRIVNYFQDTIHADVHEIIFANEKNFSLKQNFPNPFNSITNFEFHILLKEFVRLRVFDVLGREVATLVSEQLLPGNYRIQWNASELPSGVYFFTMNTKSFTTTKKLLLQK